MVTVERFEEVKKSRHSNYSVEFSNPRVTSATPLSIMLVGGLAERLIKANSIKTDIKNSLEILINPKRTPLRFGDETPLTVYIVG